MIKQTQQFLIFGHPVEHSLSPLLYKNFAKQFDSIQLNYQKQLGLLELNGFEDQVKNFFAQSDSTAVNITAPFKQRAFDLVDVKTQRAQETGSVNSIFKLPNGDLEGDNTDGVGLVRDIKQHQNFKIENKNILILGAGGAVGGVLPSLIHQKPDSITVVNRTLEKTEKFKNNFQEIIIKTYDEFNLEKNKINYDLIINATPLSLSNQLPNISKEIFSPTCLCYDMVYKPEYTVFTHWAQQHGFRATDGLGMLIEQGVENFYRWFGVRPNTEEIFGQLRLSDH